jgi:hypothetical protein
MYKKYPTRLTRSSTELTKFSNDVGCKQKSKTAKRSGLYEL